MGGAVAQAALSKGEVFRSRFQFKRKDGSHFWADGFGKCLTVDFVSSPILLPRHSTLLGSGRAFEFADS